MIYTFIVIGGILVFIILTTFAYGGILAAPFVPTWKKDVKRALKLAKIRPGERMYDLGSGDGRFIIPAAKEYGAISTGLEIALLPYIYSYGKIKLLRLGKIAQVKMRNFYDYNVADADVIITFLSTRAMTGLKKKFQKELKPGARIVSLVFPIHGWEPQIIDRQSDEDLPIFVYI